MLTRYHLEILTVSVRTDGEIGFSLVKIRWCDYFALSPLPNRMHSFEPPCSCNMHTYVIHYYLGKIFIILPCFLGSFLTNGDVLLGFYNRVCFCGVEKLAKVIAQEKCDFDILLTRKNILEEGIILSSNVNGHK